MVRMRLYTSGSANAYGQVSVARILVLAAAAVWTGTTVWLSVTDIRTTRLPTRRIWWCAGAVWVCFAVASIVLDDATGLIAAAIGAAACGAFLAAVHFAHPPSMGFGDVRLAVLNGLLCGWWGWPVALAGLAAGFFLALPQALVTLVRHGPRESRPLGPYLVAGAGVVAAYSAITRGLIPF